jgi:serralysin
MGGTSATGNPYIDGLLSGYSWIGSITYSFPDARSDFEANYPEADAGGFGQVSLQQMHAARSILEGISIYPGGPLMSLTAVEGFTNASLTDAGFDGADIRIAKSSYANPTAYAYYPAAQNGYFAGDVWFGTGYNYNDTRLGNYAYATMIHELGHSLGLKHAQDSGGPGETAVPADRDALEFTVMSYRSYAGGPTTGYTNETYGYPQTFMMLDIRALQHLYGPNYNTNSSDTVYTWSPITGETFVNGISQGVPGGNRVFLTIWDGGGTDTYDFSNYSTDQLIDLRPGQWSLISQVQRANLGNGQYASGNVYNALQYNDDPRSLIENAKGGSGHNVMEGNAASNVLTGGGGNDTIRGGASGDWLHGEAGDDALYGQVGHDRLYGGAGDDRLYGGTGNDAMYGGAGSDTYEVTEADDVVVEAAGEGTDTIYAYVDYVLSANTETLVMRDAAIWGSGNSDANRIIGNANNNRLVGWGGNDTITGGGGDDLFIFRPVGGGFGRNTILDFWPGAGSNDQLAFSSALFSSREQALAACWQVGADLHVAHSTNNIVVLANTQLRHLTVDDFRII